MATCQGAGSLAGTSRMLMADASDTRRAGQPTLAKEGCYAWLAGWLVGWLASDKNEK